MAYDESDVSSRRLITFGRFSVICLRFLNYRYLRHGILYVRVYPFWHRECFSVYISSEITDRRVLKWPGSDVSVNFSLDF